MTPPVVPAETLARLHDVVVPEPVSLMPATPAWLGVLALLGGIVVWVAVRRLRRFRRDRYRREAGAELERLVARLAAADTRGPALTALPVLVKRVALRLAPREEVAASSGEAWLAFLDRTWLEPAFSQGPGRLLPEVAYARPERLENVTPADVEELVALLRRWVRHHRPPVAPGRSAIPPPLDPVRA